MINRHYAIIFRIVGVICLAVASFIFFWNTIMISALPQLAKTGIFAGLAIVCFTIATLITLKYYHATTPTK